MTMHPTFVPFSVQDAAVVDTVGGFFAAGGFLMWPILACSIVALGLAIERYLSLRLGRIVPARVRDAVAAIEAGRTEEIADGVAASTAPSGRVLAAGLRRRGHALPLVEKAMEDQVQKEALRLRGNVRGIAIIAAVSPLLGLLGTVLGIADAFAVVQQQGLGKSEYLANGIKVALYTTIFGLCVAIPATLIAAHLQARVRRALLAISETVSPAVEPLAGAQERSHAA